MLKAVATTLCLLCPVVAQAFTQCTTTQLAGHGAAVAEEGANPVKWSNYVYAGYALDGDVGIAVSSDDGRTIAKPVTIFSGADHVGGLRLGASYEHAYAQWGIRTGASSVELMFAASQDHGATWSPPIDIDPYKYKTLTQMSADGKNVHIVYVRPDNTIAIRNSTDAGRTFSEAVTIGPGSAEVVVASGGGHVYVAWGLTDTKSEAMFAASDDGGKTFSVQNLSASRPNPANEPIFALDPSTDRLSLVWREEAPMQGVYLQSLDHGKTWSQPLVIDQNSRQYMVVDDGSYIYLTYLKRFRINGAYDWQIYVTHSENGGKSFTAGKNLSGPTGISTLIDDNERPVPWVSANGAFRVTGVEADGVHIWNGNSGHILAPAYLGAGTVASPAYNSAVWEGPNVTVMYGVCQ